MVIHAGPVVQAIMAGLLSLSLVCWGIIVAKTFQFRKVNRESEAFADLFIRCKSLEPLHKECDRLREGHLAHIFRIGYAELNRVSGLLESKRLKNTEGHTDMLLENVDRAIQGGVISKRKRLQRMLSFLATTGSTAPFIGLFGTVWGIMTSFQDIGMKGSANLAVVAPGISEALVATAMGLAAAIPAVVAYNHFSNKIQVIEDDMLQFTSDFLNRLKTDLMCETRQDDEGSETLGITRESQSLCGRRDESSLQTG
ncbi:MAG: protein TolQ [Deltaproteobacteria bacterium]|jgi:biopolymer transport protein TolQ|nr:protein TolQ [Deltaproteobacteria bacterium]